MFDKEEKRIEKRREQGYMPFRFWLPKGEGCEIIILDASLEYGLAIREHNIQGSDGKFGNYETCIKETTECPVCKKYGDDSYLVLLLSILVRQEWTSKKTGEVHAYSKKLLPIKRGQFGKFRKLEGIAQKNHGTLRGVSFYMERGTGDQSFSIGEPVPFDDGSVFDFWTEEEIIEEFGHPAVMGREGKELKKENEDTRVYPYLTLFPPPDEAEVRERHGVESEAGSMEANAEEFSESEETIPMVHTLTEKGVAADGGDEDAAGELEELCVAKDLDYNDFADWEAVGVKLDSLKPKPKKQAAKKAAKKATRKRTRPTPGGTPETGGGDIDGGW